VIAFVLVLVLAQPVDAGGSAPQLLGRVVDEAGVLSPEVEANITRALAEHEIRSGQQVVVVTVPSLGGAPIEDYGVALGRRWGIGQGGRDDGALLIVAPHERQVRIEVGYGLEGELTDAVSSRIIRTQTLPAFQRGDFDAGVSAAVAAMLDTLGGEGLTTTKPTGERVRELAPAILFWILFLIVLFAHSGGRRRGRRARGIFWGTVLGGLPRGGAGGFGGGGFRGGGGSFGGGGASGSW